MKFGITWIAVGLLTTALSRAEPPDIADFTNVTGGHYQVLAQSGAGMGRQVNRFMNEMLRQYSRYFSNWTITEGARVVVFDNREDFRAYSKAVRGLPHEHLSGYCHLTTDEAGNTFYELVTYEDEDLWQVLAHEGFHQFIGYELGEDIPVWLNEGMAQYFETSSISNGRLHSGSINRAKLLAAQHLFRTRRALSVPQLLSMDRGTFYGNSQVAYPLSWALVYYLMTRDGTQYQNSQFRRYLQDLKLNKNAVASFQRRFGRDSDQWESDFESYILNLSVPE